MSTEIYYFSGTGNSLHVAKELQKRIPESKLIPIVSLLDGDVIKTSGRTVGFVFPVHALTIPIAVKKFLRKIDPTSAEYIFAVATREGTIFRGFNKIEELLKKKNKSLDAHFILNMYSNVSRDKGYKCPTETEISKIESVVQEKLDSIQRIILNKKISKEKDYYWEKLSEEGEKQGPGWVKDKYGVSWQVIPTVLEEMLNEKDPEKSKRVMNAMLQMEKIDIRKLKQAYNGE